MAGVAIPAAGGTAVADFPGAILPGGVRTTIDGRIQLHRIRRERFHGIRKESGIGGRIRLWDMRRKSGGCPQPVHHIQRIFLFRIDPEQHHPLVVLVSSGPKPEMPQRFLGSLAPSVLLGFTDADVRPSLDSDGHCESGEVHVADACFAEFQKVEVLIDDVQLRGGILLFSCKHQQSIMSTSLTDFSIGLYSIP